MTNLLIPNNNASLNSEQLTAASHMEGPMLVVAGPGSGKTFLLIERIVNLINSGISPDNILVITFTKKAAQQMEQRFKSRCDNIEYPVRFGTFHSVFFSILRFHGIYSMDSIIDDKSKMRLVEEAGVVARIPKCRQLHWQLDMLTKISYYKNMGNCLFTTPSFIMDDDSADEFNKVYDIYIQLCRRDKKLDFDDMTTECLRLISASEEVRIYWQNLFRYILVDEFQDINEMQYEVLKILGGYNNNIFAVGDDDQSIYGFRGAMPGIMKNFTRDYPECREIVLGMNYRSGRNIIAAADTLVRHNHSRLSRDMQKVTIDRIDGHVICRCFPNAQEEGEYIVNEIIANGYENAAIIYRSEHCVGLLEELIKTAGITYEKKYSGISFYEINVVAIIISYLRVAVSRGDISDMLRIVNHPYRGLSREAFYSEDDSMTGETVISAGKYMRQLRQYHEFGGDEYSKVIGRFELDIRMMSELDPAGAVIYMLKGMRLREDLLGLYIPTRDYPENFDDIMEQLTERMRAFKTIEGFINHIDMVRGSEKRTSGNGNTIAGNMDDNMADNRNRITPDDAHRDKAQSAKVTFITAHASKGLEYPVVFIAGLQENLFPHHSYLDADGIEEERRLFYVAMTRAKEKLYICGRGTKYGKRVSRFVYETGLEIENYAD